MSSDGRAAYLAAIADWTKNGWVPPRPSPLTYGLLLSDFTRQEIEDAEDAGDPRPSLVSSWLWWDPAFPDVGRWHAALREASQRESGTVSLMDRAAEIYNIGT